MGSGESWNEASMMGSMGVGSSRSLDIALEEGFLVIGGVFKATLKGWENVGK